MKRLILGVEVVENKKHLQINQKLKELNIEGGLNDDDQFVFGKSKGIDEFDENFLCNGHFIGHFENRFCQNISNVAN